jgi:hypothetical protein
MTVLLEDVLELVELDVAALFAVEVAIDELVIL